jgi:hypothetical protein
MGGAVQFLYRMNGETTLEINLKIDFVVALTKKGNYLCKMQSSFPFCIFAESLASNRFDWDSGIP